jgi:hypothetical protein
MDTSTARANYVAQHGTGPVITENELEELIARFAEPALYTVMAERSFRNAESIRSATISYAGQ